MQSESHERINIGGLKRAAKRKGDKSNVCILSLRGRPRESSVLTPIPNGSDGLPIEMPAMFKDGAM